MTDGNMVTNNCDNFSQNPEKISNIEQQMITVQQQVALVLAKLDSVDSIKHSMHNTSVPNSTCPHCAYKADENTINNTYKVCSLFST